MNTTIQLNPQMSPALSAFPNMVIGLVEQIHRAITSVVGYQSVDQSAGQYAEKQNRCAHLGQLLEASRLISKDQLFYAEQRSRDSGLSLTEWLMSIGWLSKDLLEAAQTMQIQVESGELEPGEAHAVLIGQKRLHDAHVSADFFKPRKDILQALPGEIESIIDEIFGQLQCGAQPNLVAQPQLTAQEKAACASRVWH
jgi:hypothetical protein